MIQQRANGKEWIMNQKPIKFLTYPFDVNEALCICPNCGQIVHYGELREIDGYLGCDRNFKSGQCFFDDLLPRVLKGEMKEGS